MAQEIEALAPVIKTQMPSGLTGEIFTRQVARAVLDGGWRKK